MTERSAAEEQKWDLIIGEQGKFFSLNLRDIWRFRDLLVMFVKRDIVTVYKQTILGPIWFVIQPIFTSLTYMIIFTRMAKIGTDEISPILFYLAGVTMWNYFSETLNVTSKTFIENASIFGKVYFPRVIIPLSKIISGLIKYLIQFALFLIVLAYNFIVKGNVHPNAAVLLLPVLLLLMAFMSFGIGLIITSMTTKYRDLTFLITFGISLFMYLTPVIYPASKFANYRYILNLNPLTSIFETFKYGFLGKGEFNIMWLGYTALFTLVVTVYGMAVFNKIEKKFIDTV